MYTSHAHGDTQRGSSQQGPAEWNPSMSPPMNISLYQDTTYGPSYIDVYKRGYLL